MEVSGEFRSLLYHKVSSAHCVLDRRLGDRSAGLDALGKRQPFTYGRNKTMTPRSFSCSLVTVLLILASTLGEKFRTLLYVLTIYALLLVNKKLKYCNLPLKIFLPNAVEVKYIMATWYWNFNLVFYKF
jgi:hypothetical protein